MLFSVCFIKLFYSHTFVDFWIRYSLGQFSVLILNLLMSSCPWHEIRPNWCLGVWTMKRGPWVQPWFGFALRNLRTLYPWWVDQFWISRFFINALCMTDSFRLGIILSLNGYFFKISRFLGISDSIYSQLFGLLHYLYCGHPDCRFYTFQRLSMIVITDSKLNHFTDFLIVAIQEVFIHSNEDDAILVWFFY